MTALRFAGPDSGPDRSARSVLMLATSLMDGKAFQGSRPGPPLAFVPHATEHTAMGKSRQKIPAATLATADAVKANVAVVSQPCYHSSQEGGLGTTSVHTFNRADALVKEDGLVSR